jgi:predicted acyl esterase
MLNGVQGRKRANGILRRAAIALLVVGSVGPGASAGPATFHAAGSVEQVYVTDLPPGAQASLITPQGEILYTQKATSLGGLLFRNVPPGEGYRVRLDSDGSESGPLVVHNDDPAPWNPEIHDQEIPPGGYGYLTTRDGTKLAYMVHPPTSPAGQPGLPSDIQLPSVPGAPYLPPYPTLIEYSGYGYANPAGPQSGIAVLANLMGFAVVDVNIRGTGCSGGAFDFFEMLQSLDGYDVIETISNQPWVLNNQVGMLGISYGGISQLFTAQTQPPHLAAITPLSVLDAAATTLYPGGNLNTGFALSWTEERLREAKPSTTPDQGQRWAYDRIQAGDTVCAANQALHDEQADLIAKIHANEHYVPEVADPVDPVTFVHKINVPTFMVCQWQDEQTGGHCPQLVSHFTGTDKKWFTFTNGPHIDSLSPEIYNRWLDFMMLYVAERPPILNAAVSRAAAPVIFQAAMGLPQEDIVTLPVDPIQLMPTYELALAEFEKQPMVRVLFDNGAGASPTGDKVPGNPYPAFERSFSSWPIEGTAAQTWYFGPGGTLSDGLPANAGVDEYTSDAKALPLTNYTGGTGGGGLWGNASQWDWKWVHNPAGTAVSYVTEPLATDATVVGGGAVYAWVRSSTPDVDLQATISEVRPDGNETFVQNGYMRASERALSTDSNNLFKEPSTLLNPIPSFTEADASPMPSDSFVRVPIPLYFQGHVYRAGSRIRVTIAAPNGAQPVWSFSQSVPTGQSTVAIAYSQIQPSTLVLPVIPGPSAPTPLPPCPSLRNQPCRPYVALVNGAGSASAAGNAGQSSGLGSRVLAGHELPATGVATAPTWWAFTALLGAVVAGISTRRADRP